MSVSVFCGWKETIAQSLSSQQTCVFYYSFAYISETREILFAPGEREYTISGLPGSIIQESIYIESSTKEVQILRHRFDNNVFDFNALTDAQRGDSIYIRLQDGTTISALLYDIKGSDVVIRTGNTYTAINKNIIARYYFENTSVSDSFVPILRLTALSPRTQTGKIQIHYLVNNVFWNGEYTAFYNLNQKILRFTSFAHITNNSGGEVTSRSTILIAGEPHRAQPTAEYGFLPRTAAKMQAAEQAPTFQVEEADIFYKFSLQQLLTLYNRTDVRIALLPEITVPVQEKNIFDINRYGSKIVNCMEFVNDKSLRFNSPLPAGIVRIYQEDVAGSVFLGEDRIPNTPVNERVTIQLGNVFDLTAERKQTNFRRIGERTTEETYSIEVRNASYEEKTVLIREHFYGEWRIIESSITFKKLDSRTAEFTVTVPLQEKASFTYTVRYN